MVFLHGYESHRIRKKRSLQKQIQEMKRWWNPLVFFSFREINLTLRRLSPNSPSVLPGRAAHKLATWLSTWHSSLCQWGNQVVQVVSSSLRWLCRCCPWKSQRSAASASRWAVGASARRFAGAFRGPAPQGASGLAANRGKTARETIPKTPAAFGRDVREKTPQKASLLLFVFFGFSLYGKVERV